MIRQPGFFWWDLQTHTDQNHSVKTQNGTFWGTGIRKLLFLFEIGVNLKVGHQAWTEVDEQLAPSFVGATYFSLERIINIDMLHGIVGNPKCWRRNAFEDTKG
mmetsp:Transcript_35801/g.72976  ORF Transcript_35801/g.72976 Transcript_35801/m.72976 type:complete len:103 (+) Transcript_35801:409-717(+)